MGRTITLATAFLAAFSTILNAAQISRLSVGEWSGGAYTKSNQFNHCAASARYVSGILMLFAVDRQFNWSLGFANSQWRLTNGQTYDLTMQIDGGVPFRARASAISNDHVEVLLADSVPLFNQFRRGYVLRVTAAGQVFSFSLNDTSRLLPKLIQCVREHREQTTVAEANPFAAPETKAYKGASPSTVDTSAFRAEATVMLANVLGRSGMTNFRIVTPAEFPEKSKVHAIWTAGEIYGTVTVVAPGLFSNLNEFAPLLISEAAKVCKGKFASGTIPDVDELKSARMFTACQVADEQRTTFYLVLPRKAGGFYLSTTSSSGSSEPVQEADQNFRSAAFEVLAD